MERLQSIKEELYKELLLKREEMMINQPTIEGSAKIVDEARVFTDPVAPDETKWTLIGILIGLAIPVLVFLLTRLLDTSVSSRQDIERSVKADTGVMATVMATVMVMVMVMVMVPMKKERNTSTSTNKKHNG